jgi:hypothetical protein
LFFSYNFHRNTFRRLPADSGNGRHPPVDLSVASCPQFHTGGLTSAPGPPPSKYTGRSALFLLFSA